MRIFVVVAIWVPVCSGCHLGNTKGFLFSFEALHIRIHNAVISVLGVSYMSSMGHQAVFIFCVSDAHNFDANPSTVCVITGIVTSVSLPASRFVCYRKSSRYNYYPWSRSGKISCYPTIRGSLQLRRKSSRREVRLPVHWRMRAISTFAMKSGSLPGNF